MARPESGEAGHARTGRGIEGRTMDPEIDPLEEREDRTQNGQNTPTVVFSISSMDAPTPKCRMACVCQPKASFTSTAVMSGKATANSVENGTTTFLDTSSASDNIC